MRVLVTGNEGFIGEHLCRELREHGYDVYGHDLQEGDLAQPGVLDCRLAELQPKHVIHLAAQVGREFGEDDLVHTVTANAVATTLLARACGQRRIPVVYASTSEVYGDQGSAICREDGPLRAPHNLYGETKLWGERVLRLYAPENLKICRLSMPWGPGAPPGRGRRALDNFLWQAHHRMPITVHRGAERSWCHVSDTVRGIRLVLECGEPMGIADEPAGWGIYNVGRDDQPTSMVELARRACAMTGAPLSLIELVDAPGKQTVVKRLATDKLRGLGWEPQVELDEGLPELLDWVRQFDAEGRLCA